MKMFRDFPADFKTEEYIADHACRVRQRLGIDHKAKLVLHAVVENLVGKRIGNVGSFQLKKFDAKPGEIPAFVTFSPPTMHLDEELWEFAKYEDPDSGFKIAHEFGHLFLHEKEAKAFSEKGEIKSIYGMDEFSVEWQANTFAYHFLAPNHIVYSCQDWKQVRDMYNVRERVARDRFAAVSRLVSPKPKLPRFSFSKEGEACPECANFTLVRNGTCLKCDTCGATTGCS